VEQVLNLHNVEMVHCREMIATEQKNLTKREKGSLILFGSATLIASLLVPYLVLLWMNVDFSAKIDASLINGILMGTAIIFGFGTYEVREVKINADLKILLSFPLLFFLYIAVLLYSFSAMFDKIANGTLFIVTSNFIFNIVYSVFVMWLKDTFTTKRNNQNKA
jgi:hypothetical protein